MSSHHDSVVLFGHFEGDGLPSLSALKSRSFIESCGSNVLSDGGSDGLQPGEIAQRK
jgi:hypothetical protein